MKEEFEPEGELQSLEFYVNWKLRKIWESVCLSSNVVKEKNYVRRWQNRQNS